MQEKRLSVNLLTGKLRRLLAICLLTAGLMPFAGCEEEEEGLRTQAHNQNKMMAILHAMLGHMAGMVMQSDPDIEFARMMIIHHQGAIDLANEELATGDNAEMKAMAQKIKTAQTQEIQQLQAFINSYQPDQPMNMAFHGELQDSMEKMDRESDLRVLTGDTDHDFAQLMIPHHQAALENAQSVLEYGNSTTIADMARHMISTQRTEIRELQEWLLKHKQY